MNLMDSNWCGEQAEFWDANVQMGYLSSCRWCNGHLVCFSVTRIGRHRSHHNLWKREDNYGHQQCTPSGMEIILALSLSLCVCVSPFQFVLFLQFQLYICT
jgi:hypothetical protein